MIGPIEIVVFGFLAVLLGLGVVFAIRVFKYFAPKPKKKRRKTRRAPQI